MGNPRFPLQDFLVVAHVVPDPTGQRAPWPHHGFKGYFQKLGCRATSLRLKTLVETEVQDGIVDWTDTEFARVNLDELDAYILERAIHVEGEGVWYRGDQHLHEQQ